MNADCGPSGRVVVTGMGIVSAAGCGVAAFTTALREGRSGARALGGEGRLAAIPVAKLVDFNLDSALAAQGDLPSDVVLRARRAARRSPLPVQAAVTAAAEAWQMAGLAGASPDDIGVVVAGQNLNQKYDFDVRAKFSERPEYVSPAYAAHFLDTDHVGTLSEVFAIRGEGLTVGGASASGNVGLLQGLRLVRSGEVKACMVVGALMDLSEIELSALESLGALSNGGAEAARACRPFDNARNGFLYGQAGACVILEPEKAARDRGARIWGELRSGSLVLDGNRSTDPNVEGEVRAMAIALERAGITADQVDYVNAHGTASRLGDEAEIAALDRVFGAAKPGPWVNSTKAITGHTLTAAGVVEAIATLIQMNEGFLHANINLDEPMRSRVRLVGTRGEPANVKIALSNSFGFGGINTSIVLAKSEGGSWE